MKKIKIFQNVPESFKTIKNHLKTLKINKNDEKYEKNKNQNFKIVFFVFFKNFHSFFIVFYFCVFFRFLWVFAIMAQMLILINNRYIYILIINIFIFNYRIFYINNII